MVDESKTLRKIEPFYDEERVRQCVYHHLGGQQEALLIERFNDQLLVVVVVKVNDRYHVYNYYPGRTELAKTSTYPISVTTPDSLAKDSMSSLKRLYD